jgi:cyclopropane-fatty-acyl-phospholipid synthase
MTDVAQGDTAINSTWEVPTAPKRGTGFTRFDRLLRERVLTQLRILAEGHIVLADSCGVVEFGAATKHAPIRIWVTDAAFYRAVAAGGSVGAGEAYMAGYWSCDELVGLVRLLVRNRDLLDGMEQGWARLGGWLLRGWHWLRRNTQSGSRRNIAAHYDLGNEFFALFLSSDLMYSSAYWVGEHDNQTAASRRKLELICQKLRLTPKDHLIEIGSGWGALAVYAATHYGCRVTTTTISVEQYAATCGAVASAGLGARVTVLHEDYRNLTGTYDKLVSIEMIEAVGWQHIGTFLAKCSELLTPQGAMLLQAITIDDRAYEVEKASKSFIKEYIFPGGCLPSMEVIVRNVARRTDLQAVGLRDITASYVHTLRRWRENFAAHGGELDRMGYDQRFQRLWTLYLAYCEGGFAERRICDVQLLLAKPLWAVKERAAVRGAAVAATG